MTRTIEDLLADDANFDLIDHMSQLDPGWQSAAELGFALGGPGDSNARRQVRQLLNDLGACGAVKTMWIKHRSEPMMCVLVDPTALDTLLEQYR